MDGVVHTVNAGRCGGAETGREHHPAAGLYHKFWGEDETVLVGEVSLVNDDNRDNRFHETDWALPDRRGR